MRLLLTTAIAVLALAAPAAAAEYEVAGDDVPPTPAEAAEEAKLVTGLESGHLVVVEIEGLSVVVDASEAESAAREALPEATAAGRRRLHSGHAGGGRHGHRGRASRRAERRGHGARGHG